MSQNLVTFKSIVKDFMNNFKYFKNELQFLIQLKYSLRSSFVKIITLIFLQPDIKIC